MVKRGALGLISTAALLWGPPASAQVNVTTYHNDTASTGQNLSDAWRDMVIRLDQALQTASPGDLDRPSPEGMPTLNGRISGPGKQSSFGCSSASRTSSP